MPENFVVLPIELNVLLEQDLFRVFFSIKFTSLVNFVDEVSLT